MGCVIRNYQYLICYFSTLCRCIPQRETWPPSSNQFPIYDDPIHSIPNRICPANMSHERKRKRRNNRKVNSTTGTTTACLSSARWYWLRYTISKTPTHCQLRSDLFPSNRFVHTHSTFGVQSHTYVVRIIYLSGE